MATGVQPPYICDTVAQIASGMAVNAYADVTAQLASSQSIATDPVPTAVLVDAMNGTDASASLGAVSISGTKLVAVVHALTTGTRYRLTFSYQPTPPDFAGQTNVAILNIACDY